MAARVQSQKGCQGQFAMLDDDEHTDSECEREANASVEIPEDVKCLQAQMQVPAHASKSEDKQRGKTYRKDLRSTPDTISDEEFDKTLSSIVFEQERADAGNHIGEGTKKGHSPVAADLMPKSAASACPGALAALAAFLAMTSAATGLSPPACADVEVRPRRREQARTKAGPQKPQRTCRPLPAVAMKTSRPRGRYIISFFRIQVLRRCVHLLIQFRFDRLFLARRYVYRL